MQMRDFWREMYQLEKTGMGLGFDSIMVAEREKREVAGHWLFGRWVPDRAEHHLFAAPTFQQMGYSSPQAPLASAGVEPMGASNPYAADAQPVFIKKIL